jgi:hypothetical protein
MRLATLFAAVGMLALLAAPSRAQQRAAQLLVHVRSGVANAPLADAEVVIDQGSLVGVTGPDGTFQASGLTSGEHHVRVRYLGFRTGEAVVHLERGGVGETTVVLRVEPIMLDSVKVVTYRSTLAYDMRAFNERKRRGNGYFITRADIERVKPHVLSDLLRMVPGMRFDCDSFLNDCEAGMRSAAPSGVLTIRQGNILGPMRTEGCPIQYYVDGHYEPHPNVNDLNPTDIQGLEVYVHGEQAPAQYSLRKNARCGVVLIWLRMSLRN